MEFHRLPRYGSRPALALALLLLAAPAAAEPLAEIGSGFDEAGRALNRQIGDWVGSPKPARRASPRRPMPATAPLPMPRPSDTAAPAPVAGEDTAVTAAPAPPVSQTPAPPPTPSTSETPAEPAPPDVAAAPLPAGPARAEMKPSPLEKRAALRAVPMPAPRPDRAPDGASGDAPDDAQAAQPAPPPAAAPEMKTAALPPPTAPLPPSEPAPAAVPTICPELSAENLGEFTPMVVTATQAACAVDRGVSLSAVRMKDGRLVTLEPAAVLRCEMAASVAHWLREQVEPAAATLGAPLKTVLVAASQQCRPRNRVAGAKISEHGRGNAIDLRGIVLADGKRVVIGTPSSGREEAMPLAFQERLKASACADFTTILGPGSDGYHEQHLHLDRAVRRSGAVLCRWATAERPKTPATPPKPPARPAEAPDEPEEPVGDAPAATENPPAP
ncbi:extensin family protein [Ancylobacter radicis]|uniref:Extensin family protein n=1 Tax=Ancylobacter radicis TaxID=2836179 RepID=A0ABS5R688_9HYPH|nr:extensin family protein [Ancylobacter radicis]MBS9477183.1 extensin family protein [Ancylobacter radicis]